MILTRKPISEDPGDGILIVCFLTFMIVIGIALMMPAHPRRHRQLAPENVVPVDRFIDSSSGYIIGYQVLEGNETADQAGGDQKPVTQSDATVTTTATNETSPVIIDKERLDRKQMSEALSDRLEAMFRMLSRFGSGIWHMSGPSEVVVQEVPVVDSVPSLQPVDLPSASP